MAGSVPTHRAQWTPTRVRSLGPYLLLAGAMMFGVPALGVALGELARPDDAGAAPRDDEALRLAELTASR